MPVSPGTRLGPYEIVASIGAGGYGEVFRALDTRLNRTVAIKVLSDAHVRDSVTRERFQREARAIAALSHPNICHLNDVGHVGAVDFLVMEYLEGETLAAVLERNRKTNRGLRFEQVLTFAQQIADALAEAHRVGIVHRDLKPANIIVTRTGIKLLDFGLAHLRGSSPSPDAGSATVAATARSITVAGAILGSWHYMAPEQLDGKTVDTRADIFALGAVIHEMATGRRAFAADNPASVIAAILAREPEPWTPQSQDCSAWAALERVVLGCLAKDRESRWQDARDVTRALDAIASDSKASSSPAIPRSVLTIPTFAIALTAALVLGAFGSAVWRGAPPPPAVHHSTHLAIPFTAGMQYRFATSASVAVSPNGRDIVYAGMEPGGSWLYHRRLDEATVKRLEGTAGAMSPFLSPDGSMVGFFANGRLKKIPLGGGTEGIICELAAIKGATWNRDGTIVFGYPPKGGLFRVSADGGVPQPLTTLAKGEVSHRNPQFLEDGRTILFSVSTAEITSWDDARIETFSMTTGERRLVMNGSGFARYVGSGHLLFARKGSLFVLPMTDAMRPNGEPVRLATNLSMSSSADVEFAVSNAGVLAYVSSEILPLRDGGRQLVWVDRQGNETPVVAEPRAYLWPRVSPDGRRVSTVIQGPNNTLYVLDLARQTFARTTFAADVFSPAWLDDARLLFSAAEGSGEALFVVPADGSRGQEVIAGSAGPATEVDDVSRDGRFIVTTRISPTTRRDVWLTPLQTPVQPSAFLHTPAEEYGGKLSLDGKWLAYVSNEAGLGQYHVYVRSFPDGNQRHQISPKGGRAVVWSRDGRSLFYREPSRMMMVDVNTSPRLGVGIPRVLFELSTAYRDEFDISADGQRFILIKNDDGPPPTHINVMINWAAQLPDRAATSPR